MKKIPNVHNNWDPLKEVWLGDVWPAHFYDDLDPTVRDSWYKITEWTKEDLTTIENKLKSLGVNVLRPYVDGPKDLYTANSKNGRLPKPPITPRDHSAVIGDTLFVHDPLQNECYSNLLSEYETTNINYSQFVSGAATVKLGRDIIFDKYPEVSEQPIDKILAIFKTFKKFTNQEVKLFGSDYRLHLATSGNHCDGCFMPLKEGLLISTEYFKDYDILFKDWKKIVLSEPTFKNIKTTNGGNHSTWRWMVPGMSKNDMSHMNDYVEKYCPDWIGEFKETYFEVNILVIDEKNILCMGDDGNANPIMDELTRYGITCHTVPFRTRSFWDGGLHCITLDTIREGTLQDYYPGRGDYGLKSVVSKPFEYSTEKFFKFFKITDN